MSDSSTFLMFSSTDGSLLQNISVENTKATTLLELRDFIVQEFSKEKTYEKSEAKSFHGLCGWILKYMPGFMLEWWKREEELEFAGYMMSLDEYNETSDRLHEEGFHYKPTTMDDVMEKERKQIADKIMEVTGDSSALVIELLKFLAESEYFPVLFLLPSIEFANYKSFLNSLI